MKSRQVAAGYHPTVGPGQTVDPDGAILSPSFLTGAQLVSGHSQPLNLCGMSWTGRYKM